MGRSAAGRARLEYEKRVGIEVFVDHLYVRSPDGLRHDHPIGFNLYVPFRLGDTGLWRIRPLFGFCAVFSFLHPEQEGLARTDDIQFGTHAGLGLEVELGRFVSLFADVQGTVYFGHENYSGGWAVHVGDSLNVWGIVEGKLGLQIHL